MKLCSSAKPSKFMATSHNPFFISVFCPHGADDFFNAFLQISEAIFVAGVLWVLAGGCATGVLSQMAAVIEVPEFPPNCEMNAATMLHT